MKSIRNRVSKKVLLVLMGDTALLYASLYLSLYVRYGLPLPIVLWNKHVFSFSIIFALWMIMFGSFGFYDLKQLKNGKLFLYRLFQVMAINTSIAIVMFYIFPFEIEPRRNLLIIAGIATFFIFLWRYLFNLLIIRTAPSRIIFLGYNSETLDLATFLMAHPQMGQRPVAIISAETESLLLPEGLIHITLRHERMMGEIRRLRPDRIVITPEMKNNKSAVQVLLQLIPSGIAVVEFPAFHEALTGKIPLSLIEEVWFLENLIGVKKRSYEFFKRALDIAIVLILFFPVLLLLPYIALIIKIESPGPAFFRQKRVGRHGRIFSLLKFRSMVKHAELMSGYKSGGIDPRQTRIGMLLRKSYLDELPQIWNILKGDMSFVGPRPERPQYVATLKEKIPFYEMRLLVPPGITGWAQINMENDASVEDAPEKMQYDLYYIKNRAFLLDLLISMRTLSAIFRRQGR